ncbi:amino acid permease-domain-containing protein [Lentinula edodes]|nr:amino acid permease-domain-containing protein [Lentinula edodes]
MTKLGKALMVGMQTGSEIFSSPGVVVANTRTVGASLCVWIASGLISWTCASSFAELGSAIPQNGGAQAYLAYAYCPLLAYLFAWTAIIALRPGGNAVISLIFAEYLNRIFWHSTRDNISPDGIPAWAIKLTACIAVSLVIALCVCDRKLGAPAAVVFSNVKIMCLVRVHHRPWNSPTRSRESFTVPRRTVVEGLQRGSFGVFVSLWAFDGWDQANYVAGEMHQPGKNIPRAIHSSMVIVIVLFLLANVSYFAVLDKNLVGLSNTVAMDFGRAIFGPSGGTVFGFMVAFSCFDALNSGFFTASRLIYVAGCENPNPTYARSKRNSPEQSTLYDSDGADDNFVDFNYYTDTFGDEENDISFIPLSEREDYTLNLTNFEGDNDDSLPGERQLNRKVQKQGKKLRAKSRKLSQILNLAQDGDRGLMLNGMNDPNNRHRHGHGHWSGLDSDPNALVFLHDSNKSDNESVDLGKRSVALYSPTEYSPRLIGPGSPNSSRSSSPLPFVPEDASTSTLNLPDRSYSAFHLSHGSRATSPPISPKSRPLSSSYPSSSRPNSPPL